MLSVEDLFNDSPSFVGDRRAGGQLRLCWVCAAITAAIQGASVALVERYGFMGGISSQVLDTFYGFYTPGSQPRKVIGGFPDRLVDELVSLGKAFVRPNTYGAGNGITYD